MSRLPRNCDECPSLQHCNACYGEHGCQHERRVKSDETKK